MNADHNDDDQHGRVLPFRRPTSAFVRIQAFSNLSAEKSPVPDIAKFDQTTGDADDYTHRMKMNALAVLALAGLIGGGMWIVDTMAQVRKNQDCVLMGRRNCGEVNMSPEVRSTAPANAPVINR
jgi:hypothetical protein